MKVLLVEDNKELSKAMVNGLSNEDFVVTPVYTAESAIYEAKINKFDLIILDLNLPDKSGYEVATEIRDLENYIPIIAVTARDSVQDKLKGFTVGFDDYVTKPFDMRELAARCNAIYRRNNPNKSVILKHQDLEMDTERRLVTRDGEVLSLTKIEYNILEYLLRKEGYVVTYEELIEKIWGDEKDLIEPPIRSHIKNIRKKIKDENLEIIETIPGVGYKIG